MDYQAVSKIAGDPVLVKSEAKLISARLEERLSNWQRKFLAILQHTGCPRFSVLRSVL